jgi:uncharacterized integral membrane protein (TIGR00697 family)
MALYTHHVVLFLQSLPPWAVEGMLYGTSLLFLGLMHRFFRKEGLMVFNVVAAIVANLQVLKVVSFHPHWAPVALGTTLFTQTFLVSDILTEYYGPKAAKTAVGLGFMGLLMSTVYMVITTGIQAGGSCQLVQGALECLFIPTPGLFVASVLSFVASQRIDIYVFSALKKRTQGRWLALRTGISTVLGIVVDTVLFSVLAWVVFNPLPLSWSELFQTYGVGVLIHRLLITCLNIPWIYGIRRSYKREKD